MHITAAEKNSLPFSEPKKSVSHGENIMHAHGPEIKLQIKTAEKKLCLYHIAPLPPPSRLKWFTPWYLAFSRKFASCVITIQN